MPVADPVCSVRKRRRSTVSSIAEQCSAKVVKVDEVRSLLATKGSAVRAERACATASEGAARDCARGYSTSRTCEIGLSEYAGFPYESIIYLVDACSSTSARPLASRPS
jgi:D-lactate dehydrogenase